MADSTKIVKGNAPGNFFVDTTCINCDNCRFLAPQIFGECDRFACVKRQPQSEADIRASLRALVCCPTGSIGTLEHNNAKAVMNDFPLLVVGDVFYAGFNSPRAAGGKSYFIKHAASNWLCDAPKYLPTLVNKFQGEGGLAYIFLTHRDDVADAAKYASKFGAKRIIHKEDLEAQPDAEIVLEGSEPVQIDPDFLIIPTPGHTKGHSMLLYKDKYLFSGDVFTGSRVMEHKLEVHSPLWCWYSWEEQTRSLERLRNYCFEWILPGHGRIFQAKYELMQAELAEVIKKCQAEPEPYPQTIARLANLKMYAQSMRMTNQPLEAARFEVMAANLAKRLGRKE